jgi:uncharacterized protein (UPF0332 family)
MDSTANLFLERAANEHQLTRIILQISDKPDIQRDTFRITEPMTFYSAVIAHSYYAIFFATKSYLHMKGTDTSPPEEHRKVFEEFKTLVKSGVVDNDLLRIYQEMMLQADTLLGILSKEREKRTIFTYKRMPQSNRPPAEQSVANAHKFIIHLRQLCTV